MKKYMIRSDLEGVSGVVSYDQVEPGQPGFRAGQRLFMGDLLALLSGLNAGGADEIVIYDEHFYGLNIDIDVLPANVTAICGKPPYRPDWAGGLDRTCAGLIMLGFHSKRGTGELLHHTYEPDIRDLVLNGRSIGEIGMETAIAGDCGVPLLLVTADSAGVREAKALVPEVIGVSVKESLGPSAGACLAAQHSAHLIRTAAEQVAKQPPAVAPWKIEHPELTIHFNSGPYLETFRRLYGIETSLTLTGPSVTACWAEYWQMKLSTQEAMR